MRRIATIASVIVLAGAAFAAAALGDDENTYFIELDNAFGLAEGSEVKIAGVPQGTVESLHINEDKRAVLEVNVSGPLATLGEDTICSAEPQSLIAEYFVDCEPKGPPLEPGEGTESERVGNPDIPVEQTRQTVQFDLVANAFREPFKARLSLLINEFGTALAGNPDNLNAAIRRGAPALTSARKVTRILGDQGRIIRNLNRDSDRIMARLSERREDVVRFIRNAKRTTEASADRSADLSASFASLDDFLAELEPTMVSLRELASSQTPVLRDLRFSSGGLTRLTGNLPAFNSAATKALRSLGTASVAGRRAVRKGADEIKQLRVSTKNAPSAADHLADFLRDADDPDRIVAIDRRAAEDTKRDAPTGYTGLEGLLNYFYYQGGAVTQYDEISHLLHFSIFEVESGPCAEYNAGSTVPSKGGGQTTNAKRINRCVAWLGPNQPGINQDLNLPPYHPSVCPDGSADDDLCRAAGSSEAVAAGAAQEPGFGGTTNSGDRGEAGTGAAQLGEAPGSGEGLGPEEGTGASKAPPDGNGNQAAAASRDLLGFLFGD